uniref:GrpE protein homolog n=1 Tax=Schistosoma japonicum TaxID=6182 RepID=Q5DG13_SCHJA|nr:SJCHGC04910 protein [Schistosoma japonicum]
MALGVATIFPRCVHRCSARLIHFRFPVVSGLCSGRKFSTETSEQSSTPKESDKELESLKTEMQKLTQKYDDLDDKYKRALAESENMRKRLMKQIDEAKLFGIQSFCKDLLEVADVLTTAIASAPQDQLKDGVNPPFANLYNGLVMTEMEMLKVFSHYNLVRISPEVGERFDPNIHEAIFQAPLEAGKEKNTVAVVTKIGYQLHGRPLRPAFVGVFGP